MVKLRMLAKLRSTVYNTFRRKLHHIGSRVCTQYSLCCLHMYYNNSLYAIQCQEVCYRTVVRWLLNTGLVTHQRED